VGEDLHLFEPILMIPGKFILGDLPFTQPHGEKNGCQAKSQNDEE
jgi:hypothetical protein